jgi:hypothetical protein
VLRPERVENFQDHQVERALEDFRFLGDCILFFGHSKEDTLPPLECPYVKDKDATRGQGRLKGELEGQSDLLGASSVSRRRCALPPSICLGNNSVNAGAAPVENKREDCSPRIGARTSRAATSMLEKEEWWEESGSA